MSSIYPATSGGFPALGPCSDAFRSRFSRPRLPLKASSGPRSPTQRFGRRQPHLFLASFGKSLLQRQSRFATMPPRGQSSETLGSTRRPSRTMRIFSWFAVSRHSSGSSGPVICLFAQVGLESEFCSRATQLTVNTESESPNLPTEKRTHLSRRFPDHKGKTGKPLGFGVSRREISLRSLGRPKRFGMCSVRIGTGKHLG